MNTLSGDNTAYNDILHGTLSSNSRYINYDLVNYKKDLYINLPDSINIRSTGEPDDVFVVTSKYVNRLDLVSLKYYNTTRYWWILSYYNNINNPLYLPYNTVLKIPSYNTLLINNIIKS